ncbi:MAG: DUF928 domain-containing protein [Cyanobacteria bacterium RU_5_0]|nr:DUF928 domain-containing protein [Cyanobacteria bacterium RU_5_0]
MNASSRPLSRSVSGLLSALIALTPVSLLSGAAIAQSTPPDVGAPGDLSRGGATYVFDPPSPPDLGSPPGRQRGGASRDGVTLSEASSDNPISCPSVAHPLTALAPAFELPDANQDGTSDGESVWGYTTETHPTLWFYTPHILTPERAAEFVLLDNEGNEVYRTTLVEPEMSAGIVQVSLPETVALEENKMYEWYFLVNCDAGNPMYTRGGIQRVALDANLTNQIQQASLAEQAALYASNGIWYDALTILMELRLANPTDRTIATNLLTFLESARLQEMAEMPIGSCCSVE